jgi:hypothetical protein
VGQHLTEAGVIIDPPMTRLATDDHPAPESVRRPASISTTRGYSAALSCPGPLVRVRYSATPP